MKYECLIFDLDGVVCDTAKYHYLAWRDTAVELGIELTPADNERLKGVSRQGSLDIILNLGGLSLTESERERLCKEKNTRYLSFIARLTPHDVLPGAREFILSARKSGLKTTLGSASKNARTILARLELTALFDNIQDGNTATQSKPDPMVFTLGADSLGIPYSRCVVFEDATVGMEAAHRAGMRAVGVGREARGADVYIDSFVGICAAELLERL